MKANELKVTDLMVGDWVMLQGKPYMIDMLNGYQESSMGVEPIPLTPEILEKNGFVLDEVIKEYCIYNGIDNRVSLHNDKEYMNSRNEWHVHIDSEDYCTIASCELTYVHELQHLLKLCKIYKEIVV
jgi:hypothetical protein